MTGRPATPPPGRNSIDGPLTTEHIRAVTEQITSSVGLDSTGAYLIKFTINAVVALPAAGAVLRIAGSAPTRARIPSVIMVAQWFAEHDIPAIRLWSDIHQPLEAGHHQATLWKMAPPGGPAPTPTDLARILKTIHSFSDSPNIPTWAPLETMRRRIADATHIDQSTVDLLKRQLDSVERDMPLLDKERLLPPGVIHGDAHMGNLIPAPDGPIICDFDSTNIGPREWDLTPAALGAIRFGYGPTVHNELSTAYGVDVTTWSGFPVLRRLRELQLVTSVIPLLEANPNLRPQWELRISTLLDIDPEQPWTPFAKASNPSPF
ncbi:MAG: hypothetical protein QG597_3490 [Actinomycetota bacterium]|nr:hypothetical protein [Actinomycetota bacterium]